MNTGAMKVLLKREIWEHKGALVWTPTIMLGFFIFIIICGLFTAVQYMPADFSSHMMTVNNMQMSAAQVVQEMNKIEPEKLTDFMQGLLYGLRAPFDLMLLLVLPFFCIAALYDERKDRSINFWRSLPVSDTDTVLAKVFTMVVIYPLTAMAAAAVLQLFVMLVLTVACWYVGVSAWSLVWMPSHLPLVWAEQLASYFVMMLWSLPFIAALMLAGASTRKPFLWAILPWPLLMLGETWVFHSSHLAQWFGLRIQGTFEILYGGLRHLGEDRGEIVVHMHNRFADITSVAADGQFWFGLVLGAALLAGTVYARRRVQEV